MISALACQSLLLLLLSTPLLAAEDTKSRLQDFDYLLGEWKFKGASKEYPAFAGVWSAVQISPGVILDVYKVVGDNGDVYYSVVTMRAYNKERNQWDLVSGEGGQGLRDTGTGQRKDGEIHIEQKFGVGTAKPFLLRIRYFDIQADRFTWSADRSEDGGATWTKEFQRLDVTRTGPASRTVKLFSTGDSTPK
jgi:hypothetical protein